MTLIVQFKNAMTSLVINLDKWLKNRFKEYKTLHLSKEKELPKYRK